jgi:hypothetical protein
MFSDPISITINAVESELPRIRIEGGSAIYANADESLRETISHQKSKKRIRSMMRLDSRAIVADPLSNENDYENLAIYIVVDRPEVGFDVSAVEDHVVGFIAQLSSPTIAKLYGQEI